MVAANVLETYQGRYPSAMPSFQDDWDDCVIYLPCPAIHHPCLRHGRCKRLRTSNWLERSFLEERRRTKVIPRFFTEKSCLKLVFARLSTLILPPI
jgi:transposase-like protein